MLAKARAHLTFANIISLTALFIALGGGAAFAVTQLDANSVKSKHIVNGQVKDQDLADDAHDADLLDNLDSTAFARAQGAEFIDALPALPGSDCAGMPDGWYDYRSFDNPVGYYRDPFGMVHLRGGATRCGEILKQNIMTLPPGYRPASVEHQPGLAGSNFTEVKPVEIWEEFGYVITPSEQRYVALDGITFRCAPSGQDGCP
jgi:hypothetical protein